jgi:hypothetical protein
MADFNILDIFTFNENLIQNVIWQYDNAEKLKSLIKAKNTYYAENLQDFWEQIVNDFLNIHTATDWGLNLWGKILKLKRTYNINGKSITISTELYRRLILGKLQMIRMTGTVPEINKYLNFVFKADKGSTARSYVFDNHDMSIQYVLNFEPTEEELALIYARAILPTPVGVLDRIYILEQKNIFGFYGTGFQPWGQAPFWDGRFIG